MAENFVFFNEHRYLIDAAHWYTTKYCIYNDNYYFEDEIEELAEWMREDDRCNYYNDDSWIEPDWHNYIIKAETYMTLNGKEAIIFLPARDLERL